MKRIFIDSSVLFSGSYSSIGASREIIRLAIRSRFILVLSQFVIDEVQLNLQKKAPSALPLFKYFLGIIPYEEINITLQNIQDAALCVELKDAPILAAARKAKVDYLVSLDRRHLVGIAKVQNCPRVKIVLPEELLWNLRN